MILVAVLFFLISLCMAQTPLSSCRKENFQTLENDDVKRSNCGPAFKNRCLCHITCYDEKFQHIVNCTNSGFNDTEPLEHLPNNTGVLIFTGNNLPELRWNILGAADTLPLLNVINMASNKIREIHGKTYHHVKHVQRLILDHNELSLNATKNHPRILSNFESLLELHLTDAFEDGAPEDLAVTLHEIFVNSNLTRLQKLHLEQNEISEFRDPNVFCDLPDLLHLYLGSNYLDALRFNITCLPILSFLDLENNKFTSVSERDLRTLDSLYKEKSQMTVDFASNPFECGCKMNPFVQWMNKTKIVVRNKPRLKCSKDNEFHVLKEEKCTPKQKLETSSYQGTTVALWILSVLLVILILALIYVQRIELRKKLEPVIDSVSKRVRYTSIATGDMQREMDV